MNISNNLKQFQELLKSENLDAAYVSSFDTWLNEYVPKDDCLRIYLSGFTGSVAELLVPATGKVLLFVDGRYHEQSEKQTDSNIIELVKVPYGESLEEAMFKKLDEVHWKKLGIMAPRTSHIIAKKLNSLFSISSLDMEKVYKSISFKKISLSGELYEISGEDAGLSVNEKLKLLVTTDSAFYVSTLDGLSWLSNLRGFQLPYQSTFLGTALALKEKLHIFTTEKNMELSNSLDNDSFAFHLYEEREEVIKNLKIDEITFIPKSINEEDYLMLKSICGDSNLVESEKGLIPLQANKNPGELKAFEKAFELSDKVIFETMNWLIEEAPKGISEIDFYNKTNSTYESHGAKTQSFHTISAFGSNSSIIHFGTPSASKKIQESEFALLDSGALYNSGFATDCTRCAVPLGVATKEQKEIYTVVLKSLLRTLNYKFSPGTIGKDIDKIARGCIEEYGYSYSHGTGHGVGINVHEGGYSITPFSEVPTLEGSIGSIEPGIYIPGVGGVRLENIVAVEKDTIEKDKLRFRSLVYIGFMPNLIDDSILTKEESVWLEEYEAECSKRGRSFRI